MLNGVGRLLLMRKRGTVAFRQPGGKREPGETDEGALTRELREELGCNVQAGSTRALGMAQAPAANEPGQMVEAALYAVELASPVTPQAEIESVAWIDPVAPGDLPLAPLTRDAVLPLVAQQRAEADAVQDGHVLTDLEPADERY